MLFNHNEMTTVDAAIIKHITNGGGGSSGESLNAGTAIELVNNTISVKYNTDTMELVDGKLSAKSGGSEPVSSNLELAKVFDFTEIDSASLPGGTFLKVDTQRLIHGDYFRFYKAGRQQTINGFIADITYLSSSLQVAQYHVYFDGDGEDTEIVHDSVSGNLYISDHARDRLNLELVANDPNVGIYRISSTDPVVAMLLSTIGNMSSSLSNAHLEITEMKA